ncbi:MAG: hypothetical protein V1646_02635 [bacterium]
MKKMFLAFLFIFTVHKIYPGLFNGYDKKSPEEVIRDLAIEQIDNPDDPYINYNLGVALYQTRKYEAAKSNFERAASNAKNKKLKERSYFNLANSCYKNALSALPVNWENESTKIEQDKLASAIDNAKASVKNYENILALNKDNGPAKVNLKKAKEFLEKLMKKQPQQKQDQQQDQKQGDGTDQGKQQDQQKQDASRDQKQDQKDQQSGDKSKQDQQSQQQKQDGQQDKSSEEEKKQDQTQSGEQKESQQSKEPDQQSQAQQVQAQQASGQAAQKESAEEKSMRLMLENLQSDEDSLQKVMIQRQTKDQKPLQSGQKPW